MKPKSCKQCKSKFIPDRPLQMVCSFMCSVEYTKANQAKKAKKDWVKEKAERKEKLKTLSDYEADAKKVFQAWVRKRDALLPCISCGKHNCSDWAGGHYFDAGTYSGLMFHEWNVNKQCNTYCNKYLSGNKPNYRIGLVNKIGLENVMWLEENKDRLRSHKYTKHELIEIKEKYLLLMIE